LATARADARAMPSLRSRGIAGLRAVDDPARVAL